MVMIIMIMLVVIMIMMMKMMKMMMIARCYKLREHRPVGAMPMYGECMVIILMLFEEIT